MKVPFSVAVAFATSFCVANPTYRIQRMPIVQATNRVFSATAMNNQGDLVGTSTGEDQLLLTHDGQMIFMGQSTYGHSEPTSINDSLQVVGMSSELLLPATGYRWSTDWGYKDLSLRFPSVTQQVQRPLAINNGGTIIGEVYDVNGYPHRGIYWDANNVVHDLPHQDNGGLLVPYDINDAGRIVGWNFYLDPDGSIHTFSGVAPELDRIAHSVNASGQMLGIGYGNSGNKVYIWNSDGSVRHHFDSTSAFTIGNDGEDMNDFTESVMSFTNTSDRVIHGMYFSPLTGLMALDSLLDSESISAGWHIRATYSINNRGQIIAFASTGTTMESNYTGEVVLLNPVPEPGSLAVLALGATLLLLRRK